MAKDIIYDAVKEALINDNWDVTDDPFKMEVDSKRGKIYEVDLGAEKFIVAEKNTKKILVEIKTFSDSILYKFHEALGQFLDYRDLMEENRIRRTLTSLYQLRPTKKLAILIFF